MHEKKLEVHELRAFVEAEFRAYAAEYATPPREEAIGIPWSKSKVEDEVAKMFDFLVEPYPVEFDSSDAMLLPERRLIGIRRAYVVADDAPYFLLYDYEASNFVLAYRGNSGAFTSWGIRGDPTSTFLAR